MEVPVEGERDIFALLLPLVAQNLTDDEFCKKLKLLNIALPDGTRILSKYAALKLLEELCPAPISNVVLFHVCPNDCILFRKEYQELRLRGPLLAWGMYGLERFGNYVVNLSCSRHPNKHVSMCNNFLWIELCSFLNVG